MSSSSLSASSRNSSPELPDAKSVVAKRANPQSVHFGPSTEARDEGENQHWKLQPPPNSRLADHSVECDSFDWDAVQSGEDLEVWLIRAPSNLKMKHLEEMHIDSLPKSTSQCARIGHLLRRDINYDVWSLGHERAEDDGGIATAVSADEATGLSCLLPRRSKNGKLYVAPKPITRHLVVTSQIVVPTRAPSEDGAPTPESLYQNPPRPSHPEELLKHKFMPYGSLIGTEASVTKRVADTAMDVDISPVSPTKKKSKKTTEPTPASVAPDAPLSPKESKKKAKTDGDNSTTKEKAGKKRKIEGKEVAPKQSKKAKVDMS